jgi:hypothetical protein
MHVLTFRSRLQGALDRYVSKRIPSIQLASCHVLVINAAAAGRKDGWKGLFIMLTLLRTVPIIFSGLFGLANCWCFSGIL